MHAKFLFKQFSRGWLGSVLWVVLLAAIICFFTVSAGQWQVFQQNLRAMDGAFTTVAVVNDTDFWRSNQHLMSVVDNDGNIIRSFGVDKSGDKIAPEAGILRQAETLKMVKTIDNRQSCLAFSPGIIAVVYPLEPLEAPIARAETDGEEYREVIKEHGYPFDYARHQEGIASVVLKGKCVAIGPTLSFGPSLLHYIAVFEIDHFQSPAMHPFHRDFKHIVISANGIMPSHEFPFTVGKDYLLATDSIVPTAFVPQRSSMFGVSLDKLGVFTEPEWILQGMLQGYPGISLDIPGNKRESVPWDQRHDPFTEDVAMALGIDYDDYPFQWFYTLDDSLKMSRQELTGSVTEFLESESGDPWKQTVEMAQRNIGALNVVGTENIQAIVDFNQQYVRMMEGGVFSGDEYDEGAKVCIIGTSLARENGLKVWDNISLSMQRTGYRPEYHLNSDDVGWYQPIDFSSSCLEFTEAESYRIVGIYTAPELGNEYSILTPNTIIIPRKALPEVLPQAEELPIEERAGMLSLVLDNGSQDEFLDAIAGTELDGRVHVLDQGYGKIASQIRTLWQEAKTLFIVSALLWGIVMEFFILLITKRLRPDLGIMVSLGARRNHIRGFLLGYIVILSLCGLLIGGIVGTAVYQGTIARTYDSLHDTIAVSDTDLPFALADIAPRLPMLYVLLQGLIMFLVATVVALAIRVNVQSLIKQR